MYIRKKNRTNRQEDKKAVFGYTSVAPAYKNQKNETHVDRYKRKKKMFVFNTHTHARTQTHTGIGERDRDGEEWRRER